MRKFLINIILVGVVAAIILCFLTWMVARKLEYASFRLSEDIHSIAIGPSTMQCALNDSMIPGIQNISRDGTDYQYLTPLLPKILEDNPQIDTVYINHGRFMYMPKPSVIVGQRMQFLRDKLPFIWYARDFQEWDKLLAQNSFYAAILNPDWKDLFRNKSSILNFGFGFHAESCHNLLGESTIWGNSWYDKITSAHGGNIYTKTEVLHECALTDKYLKIAIRICKSHDVVPVLFFTPLYQFERWFPYDSYIEVMKDYEQDILVADYENFKFSNDSLCRRDVHHLNIYGANEFSSYLAQNGIKTVKLKDWISSKSVKMISPY